MANCVLLVGPICSGKTKLAEKLIDDGFLANASNFYSIEQNRYDHGDGQMSGEMFAWANFLQQIEYPPGNDNAVYEFSGTGKNVYNVSGAMKFAMINSESNWLVAYCLAPKHVLMERFPGKVYNSPCPYELNNPEGSIEYMNNELKQTYQDTRQWNSSPTLKFNMNVEDYSPFSTQIIQHFDNLRP